jgi:hypothetical protein
MSSCHAFSAAEVAILLVLDLVWYVTLNMVVDCHCLNCDPFSHPFAFLLPHRLQLDEHEFVRPTASCIGRRSTSAVLHEDIV